MIPILVAAFANPIQQGAQAMGIYFGTFSAKFSAAAAGKKENRPGNWKEERKKKENGGARERER